LAHKEVVKRKKNEMIFVPVLRGNTLTLSAKAWFHKLQVKIITLLAKAWFHQFQVKIVRK
jgi:hypothetical protein